MIRHHQLPNHVVDEQQPFGSYAYPIRVDLDPALGDKAVKWLGTQFLDVK